MQRFISGLYSIPLVSVSFLSSVMLQFLPVLTMWLWSLLCRVTFLEYLLCWRLHHKLRLTFVKCVFSVCWDDHVVSISCSCSVAHNWFADVGHLCIPRINPIWPWLWFFSCVVKFSLLPFYWRFCTFVYQDYWPTGFFSHGVFPGFDITVILTL